VCRWFTLTPTAIEYRKRVNEEAPRGLIPLHNATVTILEPKDSWQNRLAIECHSDGRTYMLRGPLARLKAWKEEIRKCQAGQPGQPGPTPSAVRPC
jgi:hypothetical protein